MKWFVILLVVAAAAFFGVRHWVLSGIEEAIVASVCAEELTAELQAIKESSVQAMRDGPAFAGAALAYKRKELYEGSSLKPYLSLIDLTGDPSLARIKALAVVASARCPEVFPEPIKAERPIGLTWIFARELP